MSPVLPPAILRRLFLLLLDFGHEAAATLDMPRILLWADTMKAAEAVNCAWAQASYAVNFARCGPVWKPSTLEEGHVGNMCSPWAAPYIVAPNLHGITDAWIREDLHFFAPRLVFLDLAFSDQPSSAGLRNLRLCQNLERLAIACKPDRRGSLFDLVDILHHLQSLKHLSLEGFEALGLGHPYPYDVPFFLDALRLCDITGSDRDKILLGAFGPSKLYGLSTISLSGVGSHVAQTILSAHHTFVFGLSIEVDLAEADIELLPHLPFPSLRRLSITLLTNLSPLDTSHTLRSVIKRSRPPGSRRLSLESAFLAIPFASWSSGAIEDKMTRLARRWGYESLVDMAQKRGYPRSMVKVATSDQVANLEMELSVERAAKIGLGELLRATFRDAFDSGTATEWVDASATRENMKRFSIEEVLRKGDRVRAQEAKAKRNAA
ncbi:hypothetical protein JCM8097_007901 [Rhodosporidiobolus ruineniae]